ASIPRVRSNKAIGSEWFYRMPERLNRPCSYMRNPRRKRLARHAGSLTTPVQQNPPGEIPRFPATAFRRRCERRRFANQGLRTHLDLTYTRGCKTRIEAKWDVHRYSKTTRAVRLHLQGPVGTATTPRVSGNFQMGWSYGS